MNKYTVWVDTNVGEYVNAHKVIINRDTVSFIVEDGLVSLVIKSYPTDRFMKYNPDWKPLENTE